jgi:hypothetical protein
MSTASNSALSIAMVLVVVSNAEVLPIRRRGG